MKKRLLMQLLVMCMAVAAYAYKAGDYIYTNIAKFKILDANLVTNGSFNAGEGGLEGWTNEAGGDVDGAVWGVLTNVGPNGENAIYSQGASTEEGQTLSRAWKLPAGFYTISYWVKSPTVINSSVAAGSTNYVNFFLNAEGDQTVTTAVATAAPFMTEWTEVVIGAQLNAEGYLVFSANNVATDVMFTNFEIHKAMEVYDTRIPNRYIANVEKLLSEPEFVDGAGDLLDNLKIVKEMVAANPEDGTQVTELIDQFDVMYRQYLDGVAGNTIGTTVDGITTTRYLTDWATWGYMNWNNMVTRNTWLFEGGRWGFSPNNGDLERPANDGYVATAGIQTSYRLGPDRATGVRIAEGTFNNTSLKAGKYLFSIEAQAVAASEKAAPYGANHSIIIANPSIWVGKDTITFENDTLNGYYWKKYYAIVDIPEGTEVSAGFLFPWLNEVYQGGRYSVRNPEFRVIGKSQEEIDHLYAYDQLVIQKNALKERLDSAVAINQWTQAAGYPWGHAILQDSISKFSEVYNTLLTIVDESGAELQPALVTLDYKDEILQAVRYMNNAISNFHNANTKHYQLLAADVALCNESLNAENNAGGDKATFQAVINKAQAMLDATTIDGDQMDEFDAMDDELLTAKEAFEMGTASRANPASLYIKGRNLNFESWTSKSTYGEDKTGENAVNGWNIYIGADGKQWDIQPSDRYELGGRASIWRGTSVGPNGKMQQTITLTKPGVYEFRSKAFSAEYGDGSRWNEYMAIANICGSILDWDTFDNTPVDTVYHPNVRLFFGPDGAVNDSITLTKCAPADYLRDSKGLIYTRETPMEYSILYVKNGSEAETFEFGLEAFENSASAGACTFGFGDNRLYYLGSEAAYVAATEADYNAEVAKAKALIAQHGIDNPTTAWIIYKLMRLVGDEEYPWAEGLGYTAPATVQDKQNVYLTLKEYELMLERTLDPTLGIVEAKTGHVKAIVADGIYTLSGMKVGRAADMQNMKPGLYIVNGKKYLVK